MFELAPGMCHVEQMVRCRTSQLRRPTLPRQVGGPSPSRVWVASNSPGHRGTSTLDRAFDQRRREDKGLSSASECSLIEYSGR
jgi:hypothetical protein